MKRDATSKPFTGKHMSLILVAFFLVVFAINMAMARLATSTFGGVVVENSYVASQHFNRWLNEAAEEKALGWTVAAERRPDDRIELQLAKVPADARVTAVARHPLGRLPDQELSFVQSADGGYVSSQPLPAGRWTLRILVRADAAVWRTELALH
ncbi:FixH family protein [Novosphingobium aquimarinum]|uniref:FixH family protein n=1 Tax=Novosphingobium aquimarinum TaxID=2682494 RepID=UPI0012EBDAEB|nr:FixH family protein [Novosphingobium aquimarinum]